MQRFTVLLPMKGHSERVPNKNMKLFNGRPLYHAVMLELERCELVTQVLINTDSDRIAEDAVTNFSKARIVQRPAELKGDLVSMNRIIEHDLLTCSADHFIQTHSTNPLLKAETLSKAAAAYLRDLASYDSVFSVTRLQTRLYTADASPVNHNPQELIRTQDLAPLFEENSCFYIFSRSSFLASGGRRIGLKPRLFEMDKLEAVDIDEPEDFFLAELLYKQHHS